MPSSDIDSCTSKRCSPHLSPKSWACPVLDMSIRSRIQDIPELYQETHQQQIICSETKSMYLINLRSDADRVSLFTYLSCNCRAALLIALLIDSDNSSVFNASAHPHLLLPRMTALVGFDFFIHFPLLHQHGKFLAFNK